MKQAWVLTYKDIAHLTFLRNRRTRDTMASQLRQLENGIMKYTMEDDSPRVSDYTNEEYSSSVSGASITPQIGDVQDLDVHDEILPIEQQAGLVHGHIHNYENFTYIHGHIHTNENASCNALESCVCDEDVKRKPSRRSSLHKHTNDLHSENFSECQHFEFLNCHDNTPLLPVNLDDDSITCNMHENCKPKIVEVCCDTLHNEDSSGPFPLNSGHVLPTEDVHLHEGTTDHTFDFERALLDCGLGDCIDIKCDLDTCDTNDLHCKYCDVVEELPSIKQEFDIEPTPNNQLSNLKRQRNESFSNEYIHMHSHVHHQHLEGFQHHLHHKQHHQHPENHHHHLFQLHEHQQKKIKTDDGSELINFEWNFKNQETKCEWENCSTMLNNSLQLQNHIMEDHILSEYPDLNATPAHDHSFECEWKNCDYSGVDIFSLVNHVNLKHGLQGLPDTLKFDLRKQDGSLEQLPTPSEALEKTTTRARRGRRIQQQQEEEPEQTVCKWLVEDEHGNQHDCNKQCRTAGELTDHLIVDHIGSGKSEYTCLWKGCDRNHRNFNQRQKIIRHLHVHTRYKPFKCEECGHSFAIESMLEQHMRTHSGEKPYACKQCGKHFATSSSLSIHMRTHTGEKPLMCKYPGCGKRFSESSNLTKHIKTHEKTYKCECCSKSFTKEKQLENHMAKYHT